MSTFRSTDDRDRDYRRHKEIITLLRNINERLDRLEMEHLSHSMKPSRYVDPVIEEAVRASWRV